MDVLLSFITPTLNDDINDTYPNTYTHQLYYGNYYSFDPTPLNLTQSLSSFLIFDYNNDLYPDLLAIDTLYQQRTIWLNVASSSPSSSSYNSRNFTLLPQPINTTTSTGQSAYNSLSSTPFSSFIDMNGDCRSDLVLHTYDTVNKRSQLEIWINHASANNIYNSLWSLHFVSKLRNITLHQTYMNTHR